MEAVGFTGGIWLFWKDDFNAHVIFNHKQFIHVYVSNANGLVSWITIVYRSPIPNIRKLLWHDLSEFTSTVKGLWLLGGEFHVILYPFKKKKGGFIRSSGVCH